MSDDSDYDINSGMVQLKSYDSHQDFEENLKSELNSNVEPQSNVSRISSGKSSLYKKQKLSDDSAFWSEDGSLIEHDTNTSTITSASPKMTRQERIETRKRLYSLKNNANSSQTSSSTEDDVQSSRKAKESREKFAGFLDRQAEHAQEKRKKIKEMREEQKKEYSNYSYQSERSQYLLYLYEKRTGMKIDSTERLLKRARDIDTSSQEQYDVSLTSSEFARNVQSSPERKEGEKKEERVCVYEADIIRKKKKDKAIQEILEERAKREEEELKNSFKKPSLSLPKEKINEMAKRAEIRREQKKEQRERELQEQMKPKKISHKKQPKYQRAVCDFSRMLRADDEAEKAE